MEYAKNVTETNKRLSQAAKTKPAPERAGLKLCEKANASRTGVQHRNGAAVLRPARDVIAYRDRAFLAVGDGPHPRGIDAARRQEGPNRLGTAGAKRNIVFAGAALVRMAFNGEGIAVVGLQPARLLLQGRDRLRRQIGLVALEEHAVADIDHEILLAARGRGTCHRAVGEVLVGAGAHRQCHRENRGQLQSLEDTHLMFHSGASALTFFDCYPVYRAMVKRTFRQP